MDGKDAIRAGMDISLLVLHRYLDDLSDEDLMRRPGIGCNHLAWQLGHLISSEAGLLNMVCPGKGPELPAGFAEHHSKAHCSSDDANDFVSKQQYLDLYQRVRQSTLQALAELPDAELDAPGPAAFRERFPTVGSLFMLIGTHPLMHSGQFAVARRQLGKPIVI